MKSFTGQTSSFRKIITFILVIALALLGGVVLYATIRQSGTDIRSKAAEQDFLVKSWDLTTGDLGWKTQNASPSAFTNGIFEFTKVQGKNPVLVNSAVSTKLEKGKKKLKFRMSVTASEVKDVTFKMQYTISGKDAAQTVDFKATTDGQMHDYVVQFKETLNAITVKEIRIIGQGASVGSVMKIGPQIALYGVKNVGLVNKKGKISVADSVYTLTVSSSEKYALAGESGVTFDSFTGKTVNVTGTLGYGADGKTATVTVVSQGDITLAVDEVAVRVWEFDSGREKWTAIKAKSSEVKDGKFSITTKKSVSALQNDSVGLSVSKGTKIQVNLAVTNPDSAAFAYTLKYRSKAKGDSDYVWKSASVKGTGDGKMTTADIPITSGSKKISHIRLYFKGAPDGALVNVDSVKVFANKPVGTIDKVGKLTGSASPYTLTVSSSERYAVQAATGVTVAFADLTNKKVFVTGSLGYAADGKTKLLTVTDPDDIGLAEEEVTVKEWTFDAASDLDDWTTEATKSATDGMMKLNVVKKGKAIISDNDAAIAVGKGIKYFVIDTAVKYPNVGPYSLKLSYLPEGAGNWVTKTVSGEADGNSAEVEFKISAGKLVISKLMFEFVDAPKDAVILIDTIKLIATVPAGNTVQNGVLRKESDTGKFRLVAGKTTYYVVPASSAVSFDSSVGQVVGVEGEFDTAATGVYPTIKVSDLYFVAARPSPTPKPKQASSPVEEAPGEAPGSVAPQPATNDTSNINEVPDSSQTNYEGPCPGGHCN